MACHSVSGCGKIHTYRKSVKPARLERQKEKALKQNSPKSYKNESAERKTSKRKQKKKT